MGTISGIVATIYNLLPDFSGIMLAAVGAAMIFAPNWVDRIGPKWRWGIAAVLMLLGGLGMRSSFTQHRDADKAQTDLGRKIDNLLQTSNRLQSTIDTYGPKLDALIQNPASHEQKQKAIALRQALPTPSIPSNGAQYGNLVERTVQLRSHVVLDLMFGGFWIGDEDSGHTILPRMPLSELTQRWDARVTVFCSNYLGIAEGLRNEYASFHLVDEDLDDELKIISMRRDAIREGVNPNMPPIAPIVIEEVVDKLVALGKRIPVVKPQ